MTLQNIKISLRTDDLSNWTQSNPILKTGELAVVNDISAGIVRFKVGNGLSTFQQLSYVNQNKVITELIDADGVQSQYIEQGIRSSASPFGLAAGYVVSANASFSQAFGFNAETKVGNDYSFVWNGDDTATIGDFYQSHGKGTFNLNPLSGLSGVYVGEQTLANVLENAVSSKQDILSNSQMSAVNSGITSAKVQKYDNYENTIAQKIELSDIPTDLSSFSNSTEYLTKTSADNDFQAKGNYLSSNALDNFKTYDATVSSLSNDGYVLSSSISAKLDEIDTKSTVVIDDRISNLIDQHATLSVVKLSSTEYEQLVVSGLALSNALYIVDSDFEDAYGMQIKNLAPGVELSDAVNLEQLMSAVGNIQLSDYYEKIETSSAVEISNALSTKADLSNIEHVVQYEQDEYGNYTAVTIGTRLDGYNVGERSFVQGTDCVADNSESHAEGYMTVAYGDFAHAEGNETSAIGYWSHAEGRATLASNDSAHAEGGFTSAFGDTSHTEGYGTITDNEGAHAEGGYTSAFGYYSHTEGGWTSTGANAIGAHAEGGFTRADGPISHVEGVKATSELSDFQSFVWQGTNVMPNELTDITPSTWDEYKAHGPGTFNINPVNGLSGVYIGETSLADSIPTDLSQLENSLGYATSSDISNYAYSKNETSSATQIATALSSAGKGYTVTIRKLDNEGIGEGWCYVGGNQIEAQVGFLPAGLRIQHVDTNLTEVQIHNQTFIVVPVSDSTGYQTVYVNGVATSNQVVQLTGDTLVELYYLFCFIEGTMVRLADGTDKPIEDITYDDTLSVWNFDEGKVDVAKPFWINVPNFTTYCWETTLSSGIKIRTAGIHGHRFFSLDENKFIYADEIAGHKIWTIDGEDYVVSSERIQCGKVNFYNIITDKHINIFADKTLAGCSLENGLYPVKDMKFVKDDRKLRDFLEFEGEVSKEWFDACRYAESSLDKKYLVRYFTERNLATLYKIPKRQLMSANNNLSSMYYNMHNYRIANIGSPLLSTDVAPMSIIDVLSSYMTATLASIPLSSFQNMPEIKYSVKSVCDALSSFINIFKGIGS